MTEIPDPRAFDLTQAPGEERITIGERARRRAALAAQSAAEVERKREHALRGCLMQVIEREQNLGRPEPWIVQHTGLGWDGKEPFSTYEGRLIKVCNEEEVRRRRAKNLNDPNVTPGTSLPSSYEASVLSLDWAKETR